MYSISLVGHVLYLADLIPVKYFSHCIYTHTLWYIGIYIVDTLLYSLYFTNCIILFLYSLTYPQVFIELQHELLFKIVILILSWDNLGVEYFRVKRELNKVLN